MNPARARVASLGERRVRSGRPRVTVAVPYAVHPPIGGGQLRVAALYREVAATFDVDLVTLGEAGAPPLEAEIVPGLREIRVPKSEPYRRAERALQAAAGHPPTLEVVPALLLDRVPAYTEFLARSLDGAALVVASHPYCLPAIEACRGRTPLVYDAHNVEATLKATLVGTATQARAALVDRVHTVEGEACRAASLVLACSADDAAALAARHGIPAERIRLAPNGVDTTTIVTTAPAERHARRLTLGLADARIALFVGSWYPPNVEAAEAIFALAARLPQVTFLLAGRVCLAVADRPRPRNLALMGTVDEATLASLLGLADVALNPTREGSGTHLKMATYLAAGLPVVTTPVGARGYDLVDGEHALVSPLGEFAARIATLVGDSALAARLSAAGRRLVQERYDWSAIGAAVRTHLDALLAA